MLERRNYWTAINRRVSRRRVLKGAVIGGAGLAGAAYVACGGGEETAPGATKTPRADGQPRHGGVLRGSVPFILGLDPHMETTFLTHALASYVYSRLYRYKTVPGQLDPEDFYTVVPELAQEVEIADGTTYTFTLNPAANWQAIEPIDPPGRQVTAEDIVYAFNRYLEVSPNRGNFDMVERVEASADGRQVTFSLTRPFGLFLNRIASYQDLWILPPELIEADGDGASRMVGSGPFIFDNDRFRNDVGIFYRRNPDYWEKDSLGNQLPYVDEVHVLVIADKNQELAQFQAGRLETIAIPADLVGDFRSSNPDATVNEAMRNILSFLYFEQPAYQQDQPPFADVRVRRALSMAVDRDILLDLSSPSLGEWPNIVNAGMGGWWLDPRGGEMSETGRWYEYDPEAAKRLLAEASFENGFEVPMHFSSTVYSTIVPYYDRVRQALPGILGEVGIRVREVGEDYLSQYFPNTFGRGEFDGMAFGLESAFSDVAAYLTNMFYPRDAGGGRNHSAVDDPELVGMIERLTEEQDPEAVRERSFEIQRYVSDRMYYVPMVTPVEFGGVQPWVKNSQNTTGPTTYALGTEVSMRTWVTDEQPA